MNLRQVFMQQKHMMLEQFSWFINKINLIDLDIFCIWNKLSHDKTSTQQGEN